MAKNTIKKLNEKQTEFLADLAKTSGSLTLSEINAKFGTEFKSGTINALVKAGKVAYGEDKEVIVSAKRKVHTYKLADGTNPEAEFVAEDTAEDEDDTTTK